jgi:hypothetical protein
MGRRGGATWQARTERGCVPPRPVGFAQSAAARGQWARAGQCGHAAWPVQIGEAGALTGGPRLHWRAAPVESNKNKI